MGEQSGGVTRPVIRLGYRIAQQIRLTYWRIFKPRTYGVKILAVNADGHVLLVRHSYHHRHSWLLPGGGIKRGEAPEQAAMRELSEETGCRVQSIRLLGVYENRGEGARNQITAFVAEVEGAATADNIEIDEAKFFPPDALPDGAGPATGRRIAEWQGTQPVSGTWT